MVVLLSTQELSVAFHVQQQKLLESWLHRLRKGALGSLLLSAQWLGLTRTRAGNVDHRQLESSAE